MTITSNCTTTDTISKFCQAICHNIGLIVPENEQLIVSQILHERINALQMNSYQKYLTFLESTDQDSDTEWTLLANKLRVGESYFFRDSGQITLLESIILPELLQRNANKRSLRIVSAGCSTGEEAYSIAIILDRVLPNWEGWNVQILGIDIDEQALQTAYLGIYSKWSFRRVSKAIKNEYFDNQGANWSVSERIRSKVKFRQLNLIKYNFSQDSEFNETDLIVCRNVFIYFQQSMTKMLVNKFVDILNINGYLLTGHGELYGINHPLLSACTFASSVIYQKLPITASHALMEISNPQQPLQNIIPNHAKFITSHKTVNKKIKNKTNNRNQAKCALISKKLITPAPITNTASNTDIINKLQTMLIAGQYDQMLLVDINLITQSSQILIVWKLLAQAHANLGQHEQAENYCNDMLKIDEFYAPTYFIMAQISLEIGQEHKRKQLLKKALYLDHNFIAPMLELAEIAYSEGHFDKAKKLRKSAHKILITLPDTATVEMLENWTVQDLREQVRELL